MRCGDEAVKETQIKRCCPSYSSTSGMFLMQNVYFKVLHGRNHSFSSIIVLKKQFTASAESQNGEWNLLSGDKVLKENPN